jgi:large subunit ribosomal protein L22
MADKPKNRFQAAARNVRMSARKARLVMDTVRGKDAGDAMVQLQFTNKRAAPAIRKLIESAVANAEEYGNREGIDIDTDVLVVAQATVDEGPRMKRWRPRSRGMSNPFTRYTCHMNVVLMERDALAESSNGRPAFRKPRRRVSQEARLAKKGIFKAEPAEKAETKAQPGPKGAVGDSSGVKAATKKKAEPKTEKKPAARKAAAKTEKKPAAKKKADADKAPAKKAAPKKETKAGTKAKKDAKKK